MRRTRRLFASLLAVLVVTGLLSVEPSGADFGYTPPASATFTDVSTSHDYFAQIEWMNAAGIDTGFTDGTFLPDTRPTRDEVAAWLYRFADYVGDPTIDTFVAPTTATYADVSTSHDYLLEIEWLADLGVGTTATNFDPDDLVTRKAMARYLYLYADPTTFTAPSTATFSDVATSHAFFTEIEWVNHRYISDGNGDGTFSPQANTKRVEGAELLFNYANLFATQKAAADCLDRYDPAKVVITGVQGPKLNASQSLVDPGDNIDLTGASWDFGGNEAKAVLQTNAGPDLCVVGGTFSRTQSHDDTTWAQWHSIYTFMIEADESKVIKTELTNVGDGFVLRNNAADFLLQGVRVNQAHDDCVQNDHMLAGWIDDSMFDGCYVFYSARQDPNTQADGTGRTVKVTNSLIRMEAMPHVFEGTAPGHGPIWKMGNGLTGGRTGISPTLSIHNTIIRADQLPAHGHLNIPKYDHDTDSNTPMISYLDPANCSNNTIVWLGDEEDMSTEDWEASYPSSCFEVVTDVSVWNDAVAAWNATHP